MRDWLLVVALVALLLVELLSSRSTSVEAKTREPDELIAAAMGGSTVREPASSPISAFFQARGASSDVVADRSALNAVAEFAARARTYAISSFAQPYPTRGQEASDSLGGQPSAGFASSHRDRPGRRADSATSMIHH